MCSLVWVERSVGHLFAICNRETKGDDGKEQGGAHNKGDESKRACPGATWLHVVRGGMRYGCYIVMLRQVR